jgi:deoxyribodipyrimidine photolyase-related protein
MGDYCSGCRFDPKIRTGARACPFNALYWNFFERHADRLRDNPRLAMVYRNLERMDAPARQALREQARIHLRDIEQL